MKALIFSLALTSLTSFAGNLTSEIYILKNTVNVGTNGGDALIINEKFQTTSYKKLVNNLLEEIRESECKFTPVIGRTSLKNAIGALETFKNSPKSEALLKKLINQNQVEAAVGYYWDGSAGDSEYCSVERLDIYFINGKKLSISHDSTT